MARFKKGLRWIPRHPETRKGIRVAKKKKKEKRKRFFRKDQSCSPSHKSSQQSTKKKKEGIPLQPSSSFSLSFMEFPSSQHISSSGAAP
ncbi:hypothetical protein IEQ34_023643 [Dendrobium chrysotoxum]|uniref:Uncharacterized protein n=1 Tax=Dendrobium chrysotoxum TaxID=161865 RepID=A0AAV7FU14_DENCH|nr:hypothetical protein IEQ34_023643 [Dendrobium chrysotoxum]